MREDGKNDQDEEASPWLDVDNLCRAAAADDDDDVRGGHTAGGNPLDVVVESGRLLLSSWQSSTIGTSTREREALRNLDATACAVGDDLTMGISPPQQQ